MDEAGTDAGGMSPLQRLILDRMRMRGWDARDVEDRGITHATLHRYMNPVDLKMPPRLQTQQQLAAALDLPLEQVQRASLASVGWTSTSEQRTDDAAPIGPDHHLVSDALRHLEAAYAILRRLVPAGPRGDGDDVSRDERVVREDLLAQLRDAESRQGDTERRGPERRR